MRTVLLLLSIASLPAADVPRFDVASIRPHAPGDARFGVKMPVGGRFSATGVTAKLVLMLAYDVQESQIVGGPGWFSTEKWDIQAKSDAPVQDKNDETRRMVQNLLIDRFHLQVHRETAARSAYVMTVAKGGPKFKAKDQGSTNIQITGNSIRLERAELARMTQFLSAALGLPVIDRTGLTGLYDLSLQWDEAPVREGTSLEIHGPAEPSHDRGSIFTAIHDQLGLSLKAERVPVEVIVVDRIERPSQI